MVENRMSMRASEGYVQTFPLGRSVLRIPVQMNTKLGLTTFKQDEPLALEFEVSETGDVEHVMVREAPSDKAGPIFQQSMSECPQMTPAMRDGVPVRVALQFEFMPAMVSLLQRL